MRASLVGPASNRSTGNENELLIKATPPLQRKNDVPLGSGSRKSISPQSKTPEITRNALQLTKASPVIVATIETLQKKSPAYEIMI
jgi:hypothetical protein